MSGRPRKRGFYILAFLISLAALVYAFRGVDWRELGRYLKSADPLWLLAATGVSIGFYLLRSWRWMSFYQKDAEHVPFWPFYRANMLGYLGNSFLPARAGDAIRLVNAARGTGLDAPRLLGTLIIERVLDSFGLAFVIVLACLILPGLKRDFFHAAVVVLGLMTAVVTLAFYRARVGRLLALAISRLRIKEASRQKFLDIADRTLSSGDLFRYNGRLVFTVTQTLVIWLLDGSYIFLSAHSIGAGFPFAAAILLSAGFGLSSAMPSTPGYIGVYQAVGVIILAIFGVKKEMALAVVLVYQVLSWVIIIALNVFIFAYRRIYAPNADRRF